MPGLKPSSLCPMILRGWEVSEGSVCVDCVQKACGGNGYLCLDVNAVQTEQNNDALLAFLHRGYLYAKNQTDAPTVRS